MTKANRIEEIKKHLTEKGKINVDELCEMFEVSSVTIRNDLSILEREGFLIRSRGGAVLRDGGGFFATDFYNPLSFHALEKKKSIAKVTAKHIKEGAWIYLSSGSTCYEIGKQLLRRNLHIVTAGLDTAIELSKSKSLEILIPGGNLVRGNGFSFLAGDWYLRSLNEMRFDQALVGVMGVDINEGFTVNNAIEFRLIEKIKQVSKETIVVADSTKFGQRSFMPVAELTYADTIITNNDVSEEYRRYFDSHNIKLLTD